MIQFSFKRFPDLSHLLKTKIYNYINKQEEIVTEEL